MFQKDYWNDSDVPVGGTTPLGQSVLGPQTPSDSENKKDHTPVPSASKGDSGISDKFPMSMNFFSITPLPFKKTPIRHKELVMFQRILKAPYQNVPLLLVDRDEDCFPLLSLYAQQFDHSEDKFFSVTSTDFGMSYIDPATGDDVFNNMDLAGAIVNEALKNNLIPVYSNIVFPNNILKGKFVRSFLKKDMPAVMVLTPSELEALSETIEKDKFLTGGLENPETPFDPVGMARLAPIYIAPLTLQEEKVYFRYYAKQLADQSHLIISDKVCDYMAQRIHEDFEHEEVFFNFFEVMNQAVVRALEKNDKEISKENVLQSFPKPPPVYNPVKAMAHLDTQLKKKIFGQDQAIDTAYETILASLDDETRTKPTVLGFFGPSGVGKTALAEEISLALNNEKITTFNMSEYSDDFKVSQLTGSSKGYVDSDEDGLLAKAVKENPKAVILLDEFEKAHSKVQQMFLGIFDKGSLNDNHSGQIDMSQTTIILTSNAGVKSNQHLGFGAQEEVKYIADQDSISDAFPPELLGRMDAKIIFNPLSDESMGKIVDKFMASFAPRFKKLGVQVSLAPKARQELITKAQDPKTGARPILTLMRQKIKTPIEIGVLKKTIKRGNRIMVNSIEKKDMQILPPLLLKKKVR